MRTHNVETRVSQNSSAMSAEHAKFWRDKALGFDLLHATYVKHSFAPHTHEGYVIGVVDKGVQTFRYRGAAHYAPPGHVILVNPGEVHTGSAAHEAGWTYRPCYPLTRSLIAVHEELGRSDTPYFPEAVVHDSLLAAKLRQFHRASEDNASLLTRSTALFEMLTVLIQRHADVRSTSSREGLEHRKVREAREYLDAHAEREIRLERLSELVELSPSYLLRTFRRETGMTPHAYQLQKRVGRAKRLLAQGETPAQVAFQVGFYDQSHLGRHFKRFVGVTPAQFVRGVAL